MSKSYDNTKRKGSMTAVPRLNEEKLTEYMLLGVAMASLNSKIQIVVSGVEEVDKFIKASEAKEIKVKKINVSAAFHSLQMSEAAEIMRTEIDAVKMTEPTVSIISNAIGNSTRDLNKIRTNLIIQITWQVRQYYHIINYIVDEGIE